MIRSPALPLLLLAFPAMAQARSPASAADVRDYCPQRPGLGTPACTISPGRVSIETAIADWTRDNTPDERDDTVLIGDTLVRVGLTGAVEAQLGWTPFGRERTRDKATGATHAADRVGDVSLGVKANLSHPDGSGLSAAVLPFITLPVGRTPIGAGDWSAGAVVPVDVDLNKTVQLQLSPEIDAAADDDGHGHHLAYGAVAGLEVAASKAVDVTVEVAATRNNDPGGHGTPAYGAVSAAWQPTDDLQLDIGTSLGLDRDAADVELSVGISRRL